MGLFWKWSPYHVLYLYLYLSILSFCSLFWYISKLYFTSLFWLVFNLAIFFSIHKSFYVFLKCIYFFKKITECSYTYNFPIFSWHILIQLLKIAFFQCFEWFPLEFFYYYLFIVILFYIYRCLEVLNFPLWKTGLLVGVKELLSVMLCAWLELWMCSVRQARHPTHRSHVRLSFISGCNSHPFKLTSQLFSQFDCFF